ncbi:ATP-binding protein [Kitasatospora sp. NPDC004240]
MPDNSRTVPCSTAPTAVAAPPERPLTLNRNLCNRPESAGEARRLVSGALTARVADGVREDALLITSELIGNVRRHTDCRFVGLSLRLEPDRLRISVRDSSRTPPVLRSTGAPTDTGGRGLRIVAALADRWGCDQAAHGKTVWAELLLPAPT